MLGTLCWKIALRGVEDDEPGEAVWVAEGEFLREDAADVARQEYDRGGRGGRLSYLQRCRGRVRDGATWGLAAQGGEDDGVVFGGLGDLVLVDHFVVRVAVEEA